MVSAFCTQNRCTYVCTGCLHTSNNDSFFPPFFLRNVNWGWSSNFHWKKERQLQSSYCAGLPRLLSWDGNNLWSYQDQHVFGKFLTIEEKQYFKGSPVFQWRIWNKIFHNGENNTDWFINFSKFNPLLKSLAMQANYFTFRKYFTFMMEATKLLLSPGKTVKNDNMTFYHVNSAWGQLRLCLLFVTSFAYWIKFHHSDPLTSCDHFI